jgi:PAS domain S-box-containing protein
MVGTPNARVMVVDDDELALGAVCDVLRDRGYEVRGVCSGAEALGALSETEFDVILTDLMMPNMNGVELLSAALQIDPHLAGVLMTGQGTIETAVKAMQAGALDYILKPVKVRALLSVLTRALAVRGLKLENLELRNTVAIHELSQAIAHTLDPDVLLDKIAEAAFQQFNAQAVSVLLLTEDAQHFQVAATRGTANDLLPGTRLPVGESVTEWLASDGALASPQPSCPAPAASPDNTLSMPLITRGKLLGMLNVTSTHSRPYSLGQAKALGMFANAAAAGIEAARLHDAQRRADTRYRDVLDMAIDGIISIDAAHNIVVFNASAEKMFGYPAAEARGKPLDLLLPNFSRPDSDEPTPPRPLAERAGLTGCRKDGSTFAAEVHLSYRSGSPDTSHRTAVVRDVTEHRRMEQQLRQAQKLEAIGQLSAGIAHEINTPSQFVRDNILFLKEAYADLLPLLTQLCNSERPVDPDALKAADLPYLQDEIPKAIEQSVEGMNRITTIVRAMKEFSHQSHDKSPADLNHAIESTITVATNEWKYVADVVFDLDPALPLVPCLLHEFNQVVLNMVVNAAHAIAEVVDEANAEKGKITISTRKRDQWVEIRIADTGTGMSNDIKARIFDPFFTTKEVGKGTGQGLSIAYAVIVDKHQGSVDVETAPGEGTCFIIRLPLSESEQTEAAA